MSTKQCRGCGDHKPLSDFYKRANSPDGLHYNCTVCCRVSRALEAVRKRDKKSKISFRQQYRAIQLGVEYDEGITLVEVYKKDRGMCQECHKWVQPRHASMDHTQALSRGGTHTWGNVQLMHLKCNLRKSNR